jgi:hypothetical protein
MSDDLLLDPPVGQKKPKPIAVRVSDLDISIESMIWMIVKFWIAQVFVALMFVAAMAGLTVIVIAVTTVLGAILAGTAGAM